MNPYDDRVCPECGGLFRTISQTPILAECDGCGYQEIVSFHQIRLEDGTMLPCTRTVRIRQIREVAA